MSPASEARVARLFASLALTLHPLPLPLSPAKCTPSLDRPGPPPPQLCVHSHQTLVVRDALHLERERPKADSPFLPPHLFPSSLLPSAPPSKSTLSTPCGYCCRSDLGLPRLPPSLPGLTRLLSPVRSSLSFSFRPNHLGPSLLALPRPSFLFLTFTNTLYPLPFSCV